MTPEHQRLISGLAQVGRLGPFCVWPNPPTFPPERNRVDARLRDEHGRPVAAQLIPIRFANPAWVTESWEALKKGPPNDGCTAEPPWCPKGWCTGQGDCPWSRRQLGNLRKAIDAEARQPVTWYLATCQDCEPVVPQPFLIEADRDRWAESHATIGHRVERSVEVRSDTEAED